MTRKIITTQTDDVDNTRSVAQNIVLLTLGVIETLLVLRFIFKLFGANTANGLVSFVYSVTNVLIAPFNYIFGTTSTAHSVFEPSIIIAIVMYAFIAWVVERIITIDRNPSI